MRETVEIGVLVPSTWLYQIPEYGDAQSIFEFVACENFKVKSMTFTMVLK